MIISLVILHGGANKLAKFSEAVYSPQSAGRGGYDVHP